MKTLHVQIQPERSPLLDVLNAMRHLTEAGDRLGTTPKVTEGVDGVRYINLNFQHTNLAALWCDVGAVILAIPGLHAATIVCCEGAYGWDDYLLLQHYDNRQPLDTPKLRKQPSMSVTLLLEVRQTPSLPRYGDEYTLTLRFQEALSALAQQLGVTKLTDFYDPCREAAAWAKNALASGEVTLDEILSGAIPEFEPEWFEAAPALVATQALLDHLEQHPESLGLRLDESNAHWPSQLQDELRSIASMLTVAVASGQPFRFYVVP